MVPAAFVALATLPLTANGKVDRRALAGAGARRRRPRPRRAAAPRTPVEELLAGIWRRGAGGRAGRGRRRLLRPRRPFAARHPGGRRGCARRSASSCRCAPLFEAPTVGGAGAARSRGAPRRRPRPRRRRRSLPRRADGALPLSFAQQRLWFLDQLEPGEPGLQHARGRCACAGPLDAGGAGARACAEIVRRHEALRTALRRRGDGEPVQVIAPPRPVAAAAWSTSPACRRRGGEAEARAAGRARRRGGRSTSPRGPLLRAALLRLGARGARRCCSTLHHIVARRLVDGRAGARAGGALRRRSPRAGRRRCPSCRSSTPTSRVWQRRLAARARCWSASSPTGGEQLAGAPPVARAADRPAAAGRCRASAARAAPLRAARRALRAACGASAGAQGATLVHDPARRLPGPARPLHAARSDLVGRARRSPTATGCEIEGLIGFFVNTLVLRDRPRGRPRRSASCSAGCARPRSAPTPTRTCRSSSWSRSSHPSATSATRRSSR